MGSGPKGQGKCWDLLYISTTPEGSNFKFGSLYKVGCGNIIQKLLLPPKMAWLWAREHPTNFSVLLDHTHSNFSPESCFGMLLVEPKLCTKYEVATFNSCKNYKGSQNFLDVPQAHNTARFNPESCFIMLIVEPKLCTKCEVANFNGRRNK